jgi:hypothetical protein
MARSFVDISDVLAEDIEAGHERDPLGFMRAARVRTALDVVADGILSPVQVQAAYSVEFTDDEFADAERSYAAATRLSESRA